jgi:hypothetical protein
MLLWLLLLLSSVLRAMPGGGNNVSSGVARNSGAKRIAYRESNLGRDGEGRGTHTFVVVVVSESVLSMEVSSGDVIESEHESVMGVNMCL